MKRKKNNLSSIIHRMAKDGKHYQNFEHFIPGGAELGMQLNLPQALVRSSEGNPLVTPVADFRSPSSAATFDLLIDRQSINIPFVLPVPLFGVLDQESDWTETMASNLPPGVTYTVTRALDKKSLDFDFALGAAHDIINVSCNQVPYVNLLIAGLDSVFKMQQNKLEISDVTKTAQFSQAILIFNRSMFGHVENDSITPSQYKTDLQNQNDIRVINQILDIDKQRSLLVRFIPAVMTLTFTSFIQSYDKGQMAKGF